MINLCFFTPFVHIIIRIKQLLSDILLTSSIPKLYLYRFIFSFILRKAFLTAEFFFSYSKYFDKTTKIYSVRAAADYFYLPDCIHWRQYSF